MVCTTDDGSVGLSLETTAGPIGAQNNIGMAIGVNAAPRRSLTPMAVPLSLRPRIWGIQWQERRRSCADRPPPQPYSVRGRS